MGQVPPPTTHDIKSGFCAQPNRSRAAVLLAALEPPRPMPNEPMYGSEWARSQQLSFGHWTDREHARGAARLSSVVGDARRGRYRRLAGGQDEGATSDPTRGRGDNAIAAV